MLASSVLLVFWCFSALDSFGVLLVNPSCGAQVERNLCTPKNGDILVAATQDFLTSAFLLTRKDTFYDRAEFALICTYMNDGLTQIDLPSPAILKVCSVLTAWFFTCDLSTFT